MKNIFNKNFSVCHLPINQYKVVIEKIFDFHPDIGAEFYADLDVLLSLNHDTIKFLSDRFSGLPKTLHAPFKTFKLIKKNLFEKYENSVLLTIFEKASNLGCQLITFHSGLHHISKNNESIEMDIALQNAEKIGQLAKAFGIKICFENIHDKDPFLLQKVIYSAGKMAGLCLDTGHLNIFSNVTLDDWLTSAPLTAVHIHDNQGEKDSHDFPGKGNFDFVNFKNQLINLNLENCFFTFEPATIEIAKSGMKNFKKFMFPNIINNEK